MKRVLFSTVLLLLLCTMVIGGSQTISTAEATMLKSSSWKDRQKAVLKLGHKVDPKTKQVPYAIQKKLAQIANSDPNQKVRVAAMLQISNQTLLAGVASSGKFERTDIIMRASLVKTRITQKKALKTVALNSFFESVSFEAIEKIDDKKLLVEIYNTLKKTGQRAFTRSYVVKKINTDKFCMIAAQDTSFAVRRVVMETLKDENLLTSVIINETDKMLRDKLLNRVKESSNIEKIALEAKSPLARKWAIKKVDNSEILKDIIIKNSDTLFVLWKTIGVKDSYKFNSYTREYSAIISPALTKVFDQAFLIEYVKRVEGYKNEAVNQQIKKPTFYGGLITIAFMKIKDPLFLEPYLDHSERSKRVHAARYIESEKAYKILLLERKNDEANKNVVDKIENTEFLISLLIEGKVRSREVLKHMVQKIDKQEDLKRILDSKTFRHSGTVGGEIAKKITDQDYLLEKVRQTTNYSAHRFWKDILPKLDTAHLITFLYDPGKKKKIHYSTREKGFTNIPPSVFEQLGTFSDSLLIDLVKKSTNRGVHHMAMLHIDNMQFVSEMAINSSSIVLELGATERLTDSTQLMNVAIKARDEKVALLAGKKVTNPKQLLNIAINTKHEKVALQIVEVIKDLKMLKKIRKKSEFESVKSSAGKKHEKLSSI